MMSGYIDPAISPTSYDENQVAIINRYELHVTDRDGQFCVEDPFVRGLMGVNFSRFIGGNLQSLLVDAVRVHQECQRGLENGDGKKTVPATVPAKPSPAVKSVKDTVPETDSKPKSAPKKKGKVLPAQPPKATKPAAPAPATQTKTEPSKREKLPETPPTELADVELDNTGKREGKSKREITKKDRRESNPRKGARLLIEDPTLDAAKIAKKLGCSLSAAHYTIEAYSGVVTALITAGRLDAKYAHEGNTKKR